MEKTISITPYQSRTFDIKSLKKYDSIYIGSDFCENKIPSTNDIKRLAKIFKGKIIPVFPILSEKAINRAAKLVDMITSVKNVEEIVANDWGLMNMIKKKYSHRFKLILGRLIMWEISDINKEFFNNFFKEYNISSVDIDNPILLKKLEGYGGKINFLNPLQFKAVTRFCPYMKNFTSELCTQECEKYGFIKLENKKAFCKDIYLFSTAYFSFNKRRVTDKRIQRLVESYIPKISK
ncbi:MAG: hypothetical protein KA059_03125 [Elusimicrobiales bacterium]|nr:hypothetical protein [Elusimicrobiales bacterium]